MKRGEVRWYKFNKPDKNRPVLILTRNSILEYLNDITVAPLTSTIRDIPSEVLLGKLEGLPKECAINFDHIQTVAKNKIGGLITTLNPQKMLEVVRAINFALGLA